LAEYKRSLLGIERQKLGGKLPVSIRQRFRGLKSSFFECLGQAKFRAFTRSEWRNKRGKQLQLQRNPDSKF